MPPKHWPSTGERELLRTPIFTLRERLARSPRTNEEGTFYIIETPDWVNVIPLTADERVVLVCQYRHGIQDTTLEIPGGLVDPDDAGPVAAARRELLEETGYRAGKVELLGSVAPNPALQPNRCHTCLATELELVAMQQLDANEDIEIVLEPLANIPGLIHSGQITHSLVVCAFARHFGFAR